MDKEYLQKTSANITLSNEILNVFPQKMRKKITLFDIALDILDSVIGGKGTVGQEEIKLLLFANPVMIYKKKITRIRQKLLELISNVSKVEGYKISIPK